MQNEKRNVNIFGYARVSSTEQNLDRQIVALKEYVKPENIVVDKVSGKNTDREGYQALKGVFGLREGDVLYITSIDRLSRNKEDIKRELEWFKRKRVRLKILDLPTSLIEVPEGQVLASIAEQERLTIRKRQREGIEAAKKKGKHLGRPVFILPEKFPEVYERWKRGDITAKTAMKVLKMKRSTFYRQVQKYEKNVSKC